MDRYAALFSPFELGPLRLRNRIVCSPLTTNLGTHDGISTLRHLEFWRARARGGAGLVIMDSAFPETRGKGFASQVGCHSDETIPALGKVADALRSEGAASALQIEHSGAQTTSLICGEQPVAPSPVADPRHSEMPHVLDEREIDLVTESFAQAGRRIKEAGFDALEIHGAHGYLVHQFLSPYFNRRTDGYGGDTFSRTRFAREIISRTKELVGEDYPILFRISARDGLDGGLEVDEAVQICQILAASGVDVLDVSAGVGATSHIMGPPAGTPQGSLIDFAHRIKQAVSIPVIAVGRILDPELANAVVEQGKADLVALGRALIADPEWPNKVRDGRLEDIVACIGCCGCNARSRRPDIICVVNSRVGLEDRQEPQPVLRSERVAVIGTGLGGLEAARQAAARGHEVRAWDPAGPPGGLLGLRANAPGREEFLAAVTMSLSALEQAGGQLNSGCAEWEAQLRAWQPHHLIYACPGRPKADFQGDVGQLPIQQATSVLGGCPVVGPNLVVLGGGALGCETALYLSGRGYAVTLLSLSSNFAFDTHRSIQQHLLSDLNNLDVPTLANVASVDSDCFSLTVRFSGRDDVFTIPEIGSLVLALGFGPPELPDALSDLEVDVPCHLIGDAYGASDLAELVRAGALLGSQL